MSTVTNIRLHLLLKYFAEISRIFLKTLMDTDKGVWNLLSALLLRKKRRKLTTQMSVLKYHKFQREIFDCLKVRRIHHHQTSYIFFIDKDLRRLWTVKWLNLLQDHFGSFLMLGETVKFCKLSLKYSKTSNLHKASDYYLDMYQGQKLEWNKIVH